MPPTTTLTANIYGRFSVGELSGWIFFAHQVGAALEAALAGGGAGADDPGGAAAGATADAGEGNGVAGRPRRFLG